MRARSGTAGDLLRWRREGRRATVTPSAVRHFERGTRPSGPADGRCGAGRLGYRASAKRSAGARRPFEGHRSATCAPDVGAVAADTAAPAFTLAPGYDSFPAEWARAIRPLVQPSTPAAVASARLPFPRGAFDSRRQPLLAPRRQCGRADCTALTHTRSQARSRGAAPARGTCGGTGVRDDEVGRVQGAARRRVDARRDPRLTLGRRVHATPGPPVLAPARRDGRAEPLDTGRRDRLRAGDVLPARGRLASPPPWTTGYLSWEPQRAARLRARRPAQHAHVGAGARRSRRSATLDNGPASRGSRPNRPSAWGTSWGSGSCSPCSRSSWV